MKKTLYLLMVLLFCSSAIVTGQTSSKISVEPGLDQLNYTQNQFKLPDYKTNKEALNDLKRVREMVMRSKHAAFKASVLKQMDQQMYTLLLLDTKTTPEPVRWKYNTVKPKTSTKNFNLLPSKRQMIEKSNNQMLLSGFNRQKAPEVGVMKHRLDSLIMYEKVASEWIPYEMQDFSYNYQAQMTSSGFYSYNDTTSGWDGDEWSEIAYDEAGRVTMYLYKWWDDVLERWVIDEKMMLTYDENGNVLVQESYSDQYDEEGDQYFYAGNYKNEYAYDAQNEETLSIYYDWDYVNNDWIPSSKNEFYYENGMELMMAGYMWDREKDKWIGHFKFEYEIVEGIDMLSSTYYHWDYETDEWYISEKTVYELSSDANGMVVTETRYEANYETKELVFRVKSIYAGFFANQHDLYQSFRSIQNYYWDNQDSVWIGNEKTNNTFDSYGNVIVRRDSVVAYNSVSASYEWIIKLAIDANVNASGKISDYTVTNWWYDGTNNSITSKFQTLNTFNEQMEISEQVYQEWNFSNNTWLNQNKTTYVYDVWGQVVTQIWYNSYNTETMEWNATRKVEQTFDSEGNQTMYSNYEWNTDISDWKRTSLYENVTNEAGDVIKQTNIQWNSQLNKEIIYHFMEKAYNDNGMLISRVNIETEVYWDGTQNLVMAWGDKVEHVYDELNRVITATEYDYNYTENDFTPDRKYEYTYNTNPAHQMAMEYEISYRWNVSNPAWEKDTRGRLMSDFAIGKSELLLPFGDGGDSRELNLYFNFMATGLYEDTWSTSMNDWVEDGKVELYYSLNEFSATDKIQIDVPAIFPNPVVDQMTVKLPESLGNANLKLFDLQGRKIFETSLTGAMSIDMSNFIKGVYFYQITAESKSFSGKVFKQ